MDEDLKRLYYRAQESKKSSTARYICLVASTFSIKEIDLETAERWIKQALDEESTS